jgi:hypothetical protein
MTRSNEDQPCRVALTTRIQEQNTKQNYKLPIDMIVHGLEACVAHGDDSKRISSRQNDFSPCCERADSVLSTSPLQLVKSLDEFMLLPSTVLVKELL